MMEREKMFKGSLFMTIGFFFVAITSGFIKAALASTSILWVIFITYLFAAIIQFSLNLPKGIHFLKTQRPLGHIARVGFGAFATLLYTYSIDHISLLNATLLFNTAPLFIPLFAMFMVKTRVPLKIWGSLFFGFIGVIFILKPDLSVFHNPGNLIGLASGIFQGLTFIIVKMLTKTEPVSRINFYFFFGSSLILAPLIYFFSELPPLQGWIWSLCAGVMSFFAQYFIVKAYDYAEVSHIGAFQYTSVVFAGIIGWIFWDQRPSIFDLIGVFFVILGGILAITLYHLKTPKSFPHKK